MLKKLNKKGVSATVESAGMFFIIALMIALTFQVSSLCLTQILVKGASYESARAGAKIGLQQQSDAVAHARSVAQSYGEGILGNWNPKVTVSVDGKTLEVTVEQEAPIISSKLFGSVILKGKSKQMLEDIP